MKYLIFRGSFKTHSPIKVAFFRLFTSLTHRLAIWGRRKNDGNSASACKPPQNHRFSWTKLFCKCLFLLSFAGTIQAASISKADDITFEFLVQTGKETGYCDHITHIKKIFEHYQVKTLLEFGVGFSTKYFLDHCTKVLSVEFVTSGVKPDWLRYCLDLYKGYSNWIPVAYFSNYSGDFSWAPYKYFATVKLYEAEKIYASTMRIPDDDAYLTELKTFIGNLTKFNKVDLALVDPALLQRGAMVQLLFDKAPIILAHDCFSSHSPNSLDIYGYRRITVPENYEEIFIPKGIGTLMWIKKTEQTTSLIEAMKTYAKTP